MDNRGGLINSKLYTILNYIFYFFMTNIFFILFI